MKFLIAFPQIPYIWISFRTKPRYIVTWLYQGSTVSTVLLVFHYLRKRNVRFFFNFVFRLIVLGRQSVFQTAHPYPQDFVFRLIVLGRQSVKRHTLTLKMQVSNGTPLPSRCKCQTVRPYPQDASVKWHALTLKMQVSNGTPLPSRHKCQTVRPYPQSASVKRYALTLKM